MRNAAKLFTDTYRSFTDKANLLEA